jgi:hypothetical protein
MSHLPLSLSLEAMLVRPCEVERPTMNELLEQTEGRGLYLMMIVLCLPFVAPLPIAGASTPLGTVIVILAARLALGLPPRLPRCIGARRLPSDRFPKVVRGGVRLLRFIERWIKPRGTGWLGWRAARTGNALLLAFMAFLLALPLPIPATNLLPADAIVLVAASMMEEDGRFIWVGYAVSLLTMVYFTGLGIVIIFFPQYQDRLLAALQAWL